MTESSRGPSRRIWIVLAVVLVLVGATALVIGFTGQQTAPQPAAGTLSATSEPARTTEPSDGIPGGSSQTPEVPTAPEAPPAADPESVSITSLGVRSDLLRLGLEDDGTVQVPPLGANDQAGWYERGPAPGDVGPAVILGHVDSAQYGPGIFFDIGGMQPGDQVEVARADGTVAQFVVDRVEVHPKNDFPTIEVYGNTANAQLRLITCGGDFDASVRSYKDNIIVFATMSGTRPA